MPARGSGTLHQQIMDTYSEEALQDEMMNKLGATMTLARQFQDGAMRNFEKLLAQMQHSISQLVSRRAKLLERLPAGRDWTDMEDIHERLGDQADELSDELAEMGEALVTWLENQRIELEEKHAAELAALPEWRILTRWMDEQLDKAQEFADAILEQFDARAATISQS